MSLLPSNLPSSHSVPAFSRQLLRQGGARQVASQDSKSKSCDVPTPAGESFRQVFSQTIKRRHLVPLDIQASVATKLDEVINQIKTVPGPREIIRRKHLPKEAQSAITIKKSFSRCWRYLGKKTDVVSTLREQSILSEEVRGDLGGARGLYIWGPVGQGKTMLIDLFGQYAESIFGTRGVLRGHFADVMLAIHSSLHSANSELSFANLIKFYRGGRMDRESKPKPSETQIGRRPEGEGNNLDKLIEKIADEDIRVILLDELQITNISDAMILKRLVEQLVQRGVVFIFTSNCPPESLYEGGLNRSRFLPFLATLADACPAVKVDGHRDFRALSNRDLIEIEPDYHVPGRSPEELADVLLRTDENFAQDTHKKMSVNVFHGRHIPMLLMNKFRGAGLASFQDLCRSATAPSDYIGLSRWVQRKLYICSVPKLDINQDTETCRRFISLVDIFFDRGIKMHFEAEVPPLRLIAGVTEVVNIFDQFVEFVLREFGTYGEMRNQIFRSSPFINFQTFGKSFQTVANEEDLLSLWKSMFRDSSAVIDKTTEKLEEVLSHRALKSALCHHLIYAMSDSRHYNGEFVPEQDTARRLLAFLRRGDTSLSSFAAAGAVAGKGGGYSIARSLEGSSHRKTTTDTAFAVPRLISRICTTAKPVPKLSTMASPRSP